MEGGPGATLFFQKGLKKAIDEGEIELLFQPQVDLASGRIVGAEALARWQQPGRAEIGPEILFEAAAQAELSAQLSGYVQARAVAAALAWPPGLSHLRLALNITAGDSASPAFAAQMLAMLDECGFDPRRLTVEIIETELIEDLKSAGAMLAKLRASGIRLALDDFGTGYSSLLYILALPLDTLKIDKALIREVTRSERAWIVVRSVISMAKALGLQVVAEGVESDEQLRLLREEGCDQYQGFLCSPPVSSEELTRLVEDG
ncbi:MAG TPA: EAL domain-containing protein [Allosphingosinicella sp.]|jgi:EAL domain-containing protein (putative c-di-GMP-specific phosphodiesterase class I)